MSKTKKKNEQEKEVHKGKKKIGAKKQTKFKIVVVKAKKPIQPKRPTIPCLLTPSIIPRDLFALFDEWFNNYWDAYRELLKKIREVGQIPFVTSIMLWSDRASKEEICRVVNGAFKELKYKIKKTDK